MLAEENILEVEDLEITFGKKNKATTAVNGISFNIQKGETLGIVGESGSGKSVTSLAIMRLIQTPIGRISKGQIRFHSEVLQKPVNLCDKKQVSERDMQKIRGDDIAMIFQEPMSSLNPVYTCGNQVMEAIRLHQDVSKQEAKKRTLELFEKVKLPQPQRKFSAYPHELSGGQKQRVMIAMALSCNPSLLIADEPTTALDVTVQSAILDLMKVLREERNTSIIFITHDLGVIAEIADRVLVMYKGQIMEQGKILQIFSRPKHPYTKGLLACRPKIEIKLRTLPTIHEFMRVKPDGSIEEIKEKDSGVGNALLQNVILDEEVEERNQQLAKQKPILRIKELSKHFPIHKSFLQASKEVVVALDKVSFEVYPGETIGLVGESGSGKTTLGRTILRLVEPSSGEIFFEDKAVHLLKKKEMRKLRKDIQIIFQDPYASLNPRITIGQAIMEPMRLHNILDNDKQRKEKVIELLETVSLKATYFDRYAYEFSGGQRQRISIARTLALEPKFIICDESVSALDVSVQAQVLNLLNKLKEQFNLTYIFISHDLSVVKFMADRIIVLNKGKIEEMNDALQIYEHPKTTYTRQLIEAIPQGTIEHVRKAQIIRQRKRENSTKT